MVNAWWWGLGVRLRLYAADGDDLGLATVPPPVDLGDLLASADGRLWVVTALIVLGDPGDALEALAEVEPLGSG